MIHSAFGDQAKRQVQEGDTEINRDKSVFNILYLSHTFMGGPFVVGSHHLAWEMAHIGHRVLHISTPVTLAHLSHIKDTVNRRRFMVWWRGGVRKIPNLVEYVPLALLPWPAARTIVHRRINPFLFCIPSIRRILEELGFSSIDFLYIDQPRFAGLEQIIRPQITMYRATDFYEELTGDSSMSTVEKRLVKKADGLVATSQPVLDRLKQLDPHKATLVLPNGVDYKHFSRRTEPPPEYAHIKRPRLVYAGALDERLDFEALQSLARQFPQASIVLIGPHDSHITQITSTLPNMYALGSRSYSVLPSYLQHADLGLLPFSDHPANAGRSPMKLYEYAAAGLWVVAKETPVLSTAKQPFVHTYRLQEDIGRVVAATLSLETERSTIQYQASTYSWTAKATTLLSFSSDLLKEKRS